MKTKFFKIITPIVVILLAIGGSFVTHASEKRALIITTGYIHPPCTLTVPCSTIFGPVCTALYQGQLYQAYGKVNPTDTYCCVVVYRFI